MPDSPPIEPRVVLTIGGSDPSGGAGVQADLKTFVQHGVYGASALTLLTVQNTLGVQRVHLLSADLVREQIRCVLDDLQPQVLKIGALGSVEIIAAVADELGEGPPPLVVDPVMVSKHGAPLLDEEAVAALRRRILPRALVLTPNRLEAERLSGRQVRSEEDAVRAARDILELGVAHVLLKTASDGAALDLLVSRGGVVRLSADWTPGAGNHGSGCVLSAAIAARLALQPELDVAAAAEAAKEYVSQAVRSWARVGHGVQPVNTLVRPRQD